MLNAAAEPVVITFTRPDWMNSGLCAEPSYDTATFFPNRGQRPDAALEVCRRCKVTDECLEYALADRTLDGIWGATTPDDRRRMRGAK